MNRAVTTPFSSHMIPSPSLGPEMDSPVLGGTVARSGGGGGGVLVPGTLSQEERSEGGDFALDLVRR